MKRALEYRAFPLYFPAHVALDYFRIHRILGLLAGHGFRSLDDLQASRPRTGDTLFVLGSGASISTYDDGKWDEIRRADSVGFNFWPVHDFVPTFYQVEIPQAGDERIVRLAEILNHRYEGYRDVPILLKTMHITPHRLEVFLGALDPRYLARVHVSEMLQIPGLAYRTKERSVRWLDRLGFYEPGGRRRKITGWASSVTDLVHLGVRLGYRKIVLCGVDLNDSRYFYDVDAEYYAKQGVPLPGNIFDPKATHTVNRPVELLPDSPEWGAVKLKDTLKILRDVVLAPRGIELRVALKTSALYPELGSHFE